MRMAASRLVLALAALGWAGAAAASDFHPAATPPEKALDATVRLADRDAGFHFYVLQASWYGKPADKGYSRLVTKALVAAIGAEEKKLVQANCGGKYLAGELCGHDFRPLTCAQDFSDQPYLYQTVSADANSAVIRRKWPSGTDEGNTYRLLLADGRWRIDGIDCGGATKYNMR